MQREGAGVPTITKAVNHVRGYLTYALRQRYLTTTNQNPLLRFLTLPKPGFVEQTEYALKIEHVELLAWLTPGPLRNTLWTELVGCEALRQQELCCLRWIDVFHPSWGGARLPGGHEGSFREGQPSRDQDAEEPREGGEAPSYGGRCCRYSTPSAPRRGRTPSMPSSSTWTPPTSPRH